MFYTHLFWQLALANVGIFMIMLFVAKVHITYFNPKRNEIKKKITFFFHLLIINSVFAFWAYDTYNSWEEFIEVNLRGGEIFGYEGVYNWLAAACENNYFLWRAFIWIPACLFMYYTGKRLDLLSRNFLVAMALFASFQAFTRGMLGHTMMLFGVVLFFCNKNNKFIKLIGLLLVCVSYFFHKSMYVNIIFAILALFPFKKKSIIISLIVFPFLTGIATYLIDGIASGVIDINFGEGVGGVGDKSANYAAAEKMSINVYGVIGQIIRFLPEYLTLCYLTNRVVFKGYFVGIKNEKVFVYLFRLTYVIIYIASLFYFVETSSWIYERFKYMGFFPLPFVLAKVWSLEPHSNRWIKCIILLQIFSLLFTYVFRIYNWV